MMFVVRRRQEVGRKAGVSLLMCFIDLQEAYDTVDCTLLWQVITRIGVPPQMIAVIRRFHDGMRACVRPDDGVCLDWFEVEQGVRQGCVLSPLLFNIFFAAVLNVVVQRFSEKPSAETPDMSVEIARRTGACWMRIRRYSRELYDQPKVALSLKTRIVKAEAIEALLYGCSTWTLRQEHHAKLRIVHHRVLLRVIEAQRKRPDHRMTSYNRALEITRCESIETTLRTRRLSCAGTLLLMSGGRLPKRIMFGNLEGAVRRGRNGKEKEWTDCVQSDIRRLA